MHVNGILALAKRTIAWGTIAAGSFCCSSGCALFRHKPAAYEAPVAQVRLRQFAGTGLSGPTVKVLDTSALGSAWTISARVIALLKIPDDAGFMRISQQARLVIGDDPTAIFAPTSRLMPSILVMKPDNDQPINARLGPPANWVEMAVLNGAVAPGSTASVEIALPENAPLTEDFHRRTFVVAVDRVPNEDGYEVMLRSDELVAAKKIVEEKIVIHRDMATATDRQVLLVPMKFPDKKTVAVVLDLKLDSSAVSADQIAELKTAIDETHRSSTQATRKFDSPADLAIAAALDQIAAGNGERGALAFVADQTGAKLTSAVVMTADDNALRLMVDQTRSGIPALPSRDRATVAWMLDRATLKAIASIKPEDAPTSLAPIMGALSAFAGEPGRQLDVLQSLANQASGSDDLYARITAEQYIALEDNSPAVRVRAWDWISARATPPPGYDPLGPARERRNALDKFSESTAKQSPRASVK
jgi:hypothetical protein